MTQSATELTLPRAVADRRPALLVAEGIEKRWVRSRPPVLDDVSIALHPGEIAWIGGKNGAGKTTLLRILAGIIDPERGNVQLAGMTPHGNRGAYHRRIGFHA